MKDRLGYSPKDNNLFDKYDYNFKKSPHKYALYESPQTPQYPPARDNALYTSNFREADTLKKVPEEFASLRQTMDHRLKNKLQTNHLLDAQQEKGNKLNDFLRQTMSYKNTKAFSTTHIPDYAYSGDNYEREYNREDKNNNFRLFQTKRSHQQRKTIDLMSESKSLQEYEKLNDKINKNKQMIEELRKTTHKDPKEVKDFLKNVNQYKSPAYIQLEAKKQKDALGFKKNNKEEANYYLTPKVDKGNYQNRFNSSPLIQHKSKEKVKEEPLSAVPPSISSIKRKMSGNFAHKAISVDEFIIYKKLGEGKFGMVNLVRHKKTNIICALKKIPKALIKSNMMIDQLALQMRIQSCLKNANILEMYGFFDDKTHLYIVLEYMDGGTLYEKLKKEKLEEKEAAVIIRQMTSAVDYLHDIGIAHRDIKPENIVISNNVYKLCDFGWAAICDERRKTYCGTFDYVAPQILQGVEYDITVDLWCLGVLTYEILTGKAPFYHISRKETMKKILNVQNETLIFPQGMSDLAKDFIEKLIRKNPTQRIKASQALKHPFLQLDEEFN